MSISPEAGHLPYAFLRGRSHIARNKKKPHQDNKSVCFIPPYTPLLYSKTGVYRGVHYFLIFALKHRLWILVRTASFEQKYEKI